MAGVGLLQPIWTHTACRARPPTVFRIGSDIVLQFAVSGVAARVMPR
jgi:hypothetical protein